LAPRRPGDGPRVGVGVMKPRGSSWHLLGALVRNLARGRHRDADLRADIDSCVDLLTDEKIASGLTPHAARRAALMEFGSVDAVKDGTRSVRAGALIADVARDARYALRMMRRDLSFTAVTIVTLALGLGANTAIFSVVNAVLLSPLPYRDAHQLVVVWERNTAIGKERDPVAPLNYQDWRTANTTFAELGAYRFRGFALSEAGDPEQLQALSASSSLFRVLAVNAAVGRVFTEDEEQRRDRVVVLTHGLWQRRFGGDLSVVGRSVPLNGAAFTIVGVMPPAFEFPDGDPVDIYTPLTFTPDDLMGRRLHTLTVIGRLKEGETVESAAANLGGIARRIAVADSTSNPDVTVLGAHDVVVEDVRLGLVVLFATVGFVLLIACANVASLLLVRATSRRREVAMRAALGAGRGRLLRQLLTESVLLALVGAAAGIAIARALLAAFTGFLPNLPRSGHIAIDATVLLFVMLAAIVTGVLFGIVPAVQAATPRLTEATRAASPAVTPNSRGRSALLAIEIAVSLILLVGAGLMIRSLMKMQSLELGFDPAVVTAQILLPSARYPIDSSQYRAAGPSAPARLETKRSIFFGQLEERLRGVAGIESVGAVSALPLNPVGADYDLPVVVEGKPRPRPGEEVQADFRVATAGYFRAMRIALLSGREFNQFDGPATTPVAIVNDTMAEQMFPGEDPIGRRLILYGGAREIVGVIGSVRHHGFTREPRPEMILPYRQFQSAEMTLVLRSALEPSVAAAAIRRAVQSIDPQQPVYRLHAMDEFLADSVAQPRFTALLLGGFAALALVLTMVGVYGVMSYVVGQRAREIAVRMALGARQREVVGMVIGQSLTYAGIGVVLGLSGAIAGARLISGLLFGLTATDPLSFASATAAIVVAALAASALPALRMARTTPVNALRAE
jgi:putative ABC transport system permease protein